MPALNEMEDWKIKVMTWRDWRKYAESARLPTAPGSPQTSGSGSAIRRTSGTALTAPTLRVTCQHGTSSWQARPAAGRFAA